MDLKKLAAGGFAIYMAANYGTHIGRAYLQQTDDQSAFLYGTGAVLVGAFMAAYFVLDRIDQEHLFSYAFAITAAYWYGVPVGYRYFGMPNETGAALYGYPMTFMIALVASFPLWWIIRPVVYAILGALGGIGGLFERTQRGPVNSLDDEIGVIVRGYLMTYEGRINRDFIGADMRQRVRTVFKLYRHTQAMTEREQEALLIFSMLDSRRLLSRQIADRLRFALVWADGKGQLNGGKIRAAHKLLKALGVQNFKDVVALEASYRNASLEGAISDLFTHLQVLAMHPKASDEIKALRKRYTGN